jgi:hypothetical protein
MHLATFYRSGRGQYLAAMRYMLDHRSGDATVGSMQDRRNRLMFEFYRRYLPVGALLTYVDDAPTNSAPPQWLIVDAVEWNPPPLDARVLANGARYHFDHRFVYDGLSGVDWYLFRRE